MELPPCPHCGDEKNGVYVNQRWFGWAQSYYGPDGQHEEVDVDNLRCSDSKTVRCTRCDEVRRDVVIVGNQVYKKGGEP